MGGISKCTVSRIVSRVSTALARKQNQFIRWPSTASERQEIKQGFLEKGGFPGVIGCIDGTHVRIQGPSAHKSEIVNRKGFHSINVQVICDHRGKDPGLLNCWHLLNETYFLIFNSVYFTHDNYMSSSRKFTSNLHEISQLIWVITSGSCLANSSDFKHCFGLEVEETVEPGHGVKSL